MGDGLGLFDKKGKLLKQFLNDETDSTSLSNNDVFITFKDNSENIWVGTRSGLNRYNKAADSFIRYNSNSDDSTSIYGVWICDIFQDYNSK